MSFCAICGRDHEPGPCPIPSVEPKSPTWESDQYRKLGFAAILFGIAIVTVGMLSVSIVPLFLVVGVALVLLGFWGLVASKRKSDELNLRDQK